MIVRAVLGIIIAKPQGLYESLEVELRTLAIVHGTYVARGRYLADVVETRPVGAEELFCLAACPLGCRVLGALS